MRTKKYMAGDVVRLKPVTIMEAGEFTGGMRVRCGSHVVGINDDQIEEVVVRAFKRGDAVEVDGYGIGSTTGLAPATWEWGDGTYALVRWDDDSLVQLVSADKVKPRDV